MSLRIRRGSESTEEAPPAATYGPVAGPASVRTNVGPNAVADPNTGFDFATLDELRNNINAQAANSIHVATASSYNLSGNECSGWTTNRHPRIYCPGGVGTSAVFEGGGGDNYFGAYVGGLEWRGGRIQNVGNISSATFMSPFITRPPSIIEDVEIFDCYNGVNWGVTPGASTDGDVCRRLDIRDCLQVGIRSGATSSDQLTGAIMEYCHITGANAGNFNPGGTVSASKMLQIIDSVFRFNHFESNNCWGLWFDSAGPGIEVHDNVFENNGRPGLFFERSHGPSELHHCYAVGNGNGGTIGGQGQTAQNGWQMLVRNSDNVELHHMDVDMETGVHRTLGAAQQSAEFATDYNFHDNRIWLRTSAARVGGYDDNTPETMFTEPTIDWQDNHYMVSGLSPTYWQWGTGEIAIPWTSWQALGFDTTGTREILI